MLLCLKRKHHILNDDYDVLFTTGPDIISTVINEYPNKNECDVIYKKTIDKMVKHIQHNEYHQKQTYWKNNGM